MKKIIFFLLTLFFIYAKAQNPLAIPDTLTGTSFNLSVNDSTKTWYAGFSTATIGINAAYLGPTLLFNKGDHVQLNIQNLLTDTTTIHWHGLHIFPENDGSPHTTIPPSTTWNLNFTVMDVAGTYWYHSHLHMKTAEHVIKGAAGFIIVLDTIEAKLNLPRKYNVDDFPIVIQSRCFDLNKQFVIDTTDDNIILVNGTLNPFLYVPAQVVRLRLLNGSTNRTYNLGLQNNQGFYQIGSDGGLLSQPVSLTRLLLAPGERAEILVNLTGQQGQQVFIVNYGSELPNGIYGALNPSGMGMGTIPGSSNLLNGSNFNVLLLNVIAQTINPVSTIPSSLVIVTPYNPASAHLTFPITITPQVMGPNAMVNGPFELNNQLFNMNVINHTASLGYTEIWTINNNTAIAHPFHVHGLQFYIVDRNNAPPPANERGRKDVVFIRAQETVKIIMKFEDFTHTSVPYMYHCHMLTHEEEGMMGQYLILNPTAVNEIPGYDNFFLYPDPSGRTFFIQFPDIMNEEMFASITDVQGRIIHQNRIFLTGNFLKLQLNDIADGIYVLSLKGTNTFFIKKILLTRNSKLDYVFMHICIPESI